MAGAPADNEVGISKGIIRPRLFTGREDVNLWVDHLQSAATANSWSNEDLAKRLPLFFQGPAEVWYSTQPKGLPLQELLDKLKARYNGLGYTTRLESAYERLRQGTNEDVLTFITRAEYLANRLKSIGHPLSDDKKLRYFLIGLHDHLRPYVLSGRPKNLEEARQVAEYIASIQLESQRINPGDPGILHAHATNSVFPQTFPQAPIQTTIPPLPATSHQAVPQNPDPSYAALGMHTQTPAIPTPVPQLPAPALTPAPAAAPAAASAEDKEAFYTAAESYGLSSGQVEDLVQKFSNLSVRLSQNSPYSTPSSSPARTSANTQLPRVSLPYSQRKRGPVIQDGKPVYNTGPPGVSRKNDGCYICGAPDHYRAQCPSRTKVRQMLNLCADPDDPYAEYEEEDLWDPEYYDESDLAIKSWLMREIPDEEWTEDKSIRALAAAFAVGDKREHSSTDEVQIKQRPTAKSRLTESFVNDPALRTVVTPVGSAGPSQPASTPTAPAPASHPFPAARKTAVSPLAQRSAAAQPTLTPPQPRQAAPERRVTINPSAVTSQPLIRPQNTPPTAGPSGIALQPRRPLIPPSTPAHVRNAAAPAMTPARHVPAISGHATTRSPARATAAAKGKGPAKTVRGPRIPDPVDPAVLELIRDLRIPLSMVMRYGANCNIALRKALAVQKTEALAANRERKLEKQLMREAAMDTAVYSRSLMLQKLPVHHPKAKDPCTQDHAYLCIGSRRNFLHRVH